MNEKQLKEMLIGEARRGGICAEGYDYMRGCDRDELIEYYISNPDWCMERNFPSLDMLRREFSDIEEKGVYVGKTFNGEVFSEKQVYIFHDCGGYIHAGWNKYGAIIPMLYFANGCDIKITGDGHFNPVPVDVPIYSFGDNRLDAISDTNVHFKIYDIDMI